MSTVSGGGHSNGKLQAKTEPVDPSAGTAAQRYVSMPLLAILAALTVLQFFLHR